VVFTVKVDVVVAVMNEVAVWLKVIVDLIAAGRTRVAEMRTAPMTIAAAIYARLLLPFFGDVTSATGEDYHFID